MYRYLLPYVPQNVLQDIKKSEMESMNAASTVKSVQMELTPTLRVMVRNVTKYTGSSWQKYILSLSTSLDICVKNTLIKKKQSTDLTSFGHIKVKRHKY